MPEPPKIIVGRNIKRHRLEQGLTQELDAEADASFADASSGAPDDLADLGVGLSLDLNPPPQLLVVELAEQGLGLSKAILQRPPISRAEGF